jgi:hypothetical protein
VSSTSSRVWARHFQDDWHARAGDPRLPYWLRAAALAYGSHADNGHARFRRGDVSLVLGSVDAAGSVRPYPNVRRAIAFAVEYGWLEEGSYWGCLIVPAHSIRKGDLARRPAPCPLSAKHDERTANRSLSERFAPHSSTPSERFEPESAHSANGSQREPLLSVLSPVPQDRAGADRPGTRARRKAS